MSEQEANIQKVTSLVEHIITMIKVRFMRCLDDLK